MKEVKMFKAIDGKLFDKQEDCINYERRLQTIEAMEDRLYLRDVDTDELYDWIIENKRLFE